MAAWSGFLAAGVSRSGAGAFGGGRGDAGGVMRPAA
jgi:hypothetical protein